MGATMNIQRVHGYLQFATVAFGLLVVVSELADWRGSVTLAFGLVGALTGLASYFTGKRTEAALERKIETLETEQAGRTLSATQFQVLTEDLRTIQKPSQPIHLMGLQGNRESIQLANVLKRAFEDAGITVDGVWEELFFGGTGPGILIRQEKVDGVIGQRICAVFHHVGLDAHIVELGDKAQNRVEVIVAYKP
jgi:nucleotide-binding universal stress UspA family protein